MSEQKKKFSPLFLCVHLSLQPHFLSHTMDLFCRKQKEKEKREEENFLSSSLCRRFILSLSLSLVREDLSLCARAKLLGDRSEIADDDDTAEQYSYASFARAREKAPNLLLREEEEEEEHTRGENSNVFFFPENKSERTRKRRKTKR